jgi:hypothetical protein
MSTITISLADLTPHENVQGKLMLPAVDNRGKKFIAGAEGFLVSHDFDPEQRRVVIVWSTLLRKAKGFSQKQAQNVISKHGLAAFVWSPWKEEPGKKGWWVRKGEWGWEPVRNWTTPINDLAVFNPSRSEQVYETRKEAVEAAEELNRQEIKKLEMHIEKTRKDYDRDRAAVNGLRYGV